MPDTKLDTKTARKKLATRHRAYWRNLTTGLHLGYRKGKRAGVWLGRKHEEDQTYKYWRIGLADDGDVTADGLNIFTYKQAIEKVQLGPFAVDAKVQTVLDAVKYYMKEKKNDIRPSTIYAMERSVASYIKPRRIGKLKLSQLNKENIRRWRDSVRDEPARGTGPEAGDIEALRKRSATANRILTILKAALNYAEEQEKYQGPAPWRLVKPFKKVDAPPAEYLEISQAIHLLNTCPPDLQELVRAALHTGCRYGELREMEVRDFKRETGRLVIRVSKARKKPYVFLNEEGTDFFSHLTLGRKGSERIFLRQDGRPWGRSHQIRPMLEACRRASIDPPISFKGLRTTFGATLANKGESLQVIAGALGHANTVITEKHYAHLSDEYLAKRVRDSLPSFGKVSRKRVAILKPKAPRRRVAIQKP